MTKKEKRSYNNVPVKDGEVLVPMLADDDLIELLDADPDNVRTWSLAGRKFKVLFYPVPKESEKLAREQFYSALNEFLGDRRDARCLIPQGDGSFIVCPKKNGNNRCACSACTFNGIYKREDKRIFSLDVVGDGQNASFGAKDNTEDTVFEDLLFEDLVLSLQKINGRYADIVILGYAGFKSGEIIQLLKLKKSQGYTEIAAAKKWTKDYLFEA